MTRSKQLVVAGYDAIHDRYDEWAGYDPSRRVHYLDLAWRLGLVRLGDALDLGCGTGRHATALLAAGGFRVTGLDASARSIEAARSQVPSANFVVCDMASVRFPARSFDLITAFYSIIHLPRDDHGPLFSRVAKWLRPGGTLVANLGTTGGDFYEDDWLGVPMFWSSWDDATNRRLLDDAGLILRHEMIETTPEDGREITFQWVIAQRPPAPMGPE
ncbi:MAG: class I SAM-dependent methyltransferase [Acidimicrobiia bacterium]